MGPVPTIVVASEHLGSGSDELGAMLPYSPLHHVLSEGFAGPLVATSANLSGEPARRGNEPPGQDANAG